MNDPCHRSAIVRFVTVHAVDLAAEAMRLTGLDLLDILILGAVSILGPENSATGTKLTNVALAESLSIPRETCRRRLAALRQDSWLTDDRHGFGLGPRALSLASETGFADLVIGQTRRLLGNFRAAGIEF